MSAEPFSEHSIRPAWAAVEEERRMQADRARLVRQREGFVEVACPACGEGAHALRMEKYCLKYQGCARCGTMYTSPRPTPAILDDFYAHSESYAYWNEVIFPASEATRREVIFRPRALRLLELCIRHAVKRDTLLEVGAGFGTFCDEMAATGAFGRLIAVEPTPELAESCRRRGLDVRETTIERLLLPEKVDVIASFEVIEHLFAPAEFVRSCAKHLVSGGLLVLTCPNVRGFDIEVLGSGSPAIEAEHLNYFHPQSLAILLEANGFTVVESQTPGRLDADIVRNRVLAGRATLADAFLKRVLIDEWDRLGGPFQDFLATHGLSSNMWVVGRRTE